jgi:hypothetical protein
MPEYVTERGFGMYADFPYDTYTNTPERVRYTVQESSAASERKVWVGSGQDRAHLNEDQARAVRDALTEFLDDAPTADPSPTNAFEDAEVAKEKREGEREALVAVLTAKLVPGKIIEWSVFADAILADGFTRHAPETVLAVAESIGNYVAAEYEDDRALDDMILQLRALAAPDQGPTS